jgi:type IV pilus assembly protein PilN
MRVSLNLASRPYVELRPLYKRLRIVIAVLALLAFGFWYVLRTEYVRAQAAQAKVDAIHASVAQMESEQQRDQDEMQQPRQAAVLRQAQFLNNVFLRKAFSWTAVMIDLERVLPAGVQVTNIDPQVAKDGHVTVRLRVLGQHERGVDLMRNLEKSRRFLTPRLTGESAETSGASNQAAPASGMVNGVNFEIVADYNPLPLKPEVAAVAKAGTKSAKTSAKPLKHRTADSAGAPARAQARGNSPTNGVPPSPGVLHGRPPGPNQAVPQNRRPYAQPGGPQ